VIYSFATPKYQIPYMGDGDLLSASQERITALIIENQLRGGILGSGGTRVLNEGTYTVDVNSDTTTTVTLSGSPAIQGFANDGFVELFGAVTWDSLPEGAIYYLYLKASTSTYVDPGDVETISSLSPITQTDHLFLATIDTTGASDSFTPEIDTNPQGKATAFNLFELLNNNTDPFGPALTQSILTVLQQFSVRLGRDRTALFQQLNPDATLPVISIENAGSRPEIASSGELRLADSRVPSGFALSDSANNAFQGVAHSLLGALNEILAQLIAHITDSDDPHGPILTQTKLILRQFLSVPSIRIDPPPPPPPSPPTLGPPPPPLGDDCEIQSSGELRFCDLRAHIALSNDGDPSYHGTSTSIIGALNELLELIATLSGQLDSLLGNTLGAKSPIVFEIVPDDIGYNLHFKITVSEDDTFAVVILTRESKESILGWYYEHQDPSPPLPPSPPKPPGTLPGVIQVSDPPPLPNWQPLPPEGLVGSKQIHPDGRPVRVQYRPQGADDLFSRHHYRVAIQEFNLEYGEAELASVLFG
jgi:hypothetical protein